METRFVQGRSIELAVLAAVAVFVFAFAMMHGHDSRSQTASAAEPGDCISQTPSGCYGNPTVQPLTPDDVTLVADPIYVGVHDCPGCSGLAAIFSEVTSDKPVVPISTFNTINADVQDTLDDYNSMNEEIVSPSERRCWTEKSVVVTVHSWGNSYSSEFDVQVCN